MGSILEVQINREGVECLPWVVTSWHTQLYTEFSADEFFLFFFTEFYLTFLFISKRSS